MRYVNLVRNTVAVFAAGLGGAEPITSAPFDAVASLPDDFNHRLARNRALVLLEEAHPEARSIRELLLCGEGDASRAAPRLSYQCSPLLKRPEAT